VRPAQVGGRCGSCGQASQRLASGQRHGRLRAASGRREEEGPCSGPYRLMARSAACGAGSGPPHGPATMSDAAPGAGSPRLSGFQPAVPSQSMPLLSSHCLSEPGTSRAGADAITTLLSCDSPFAATWTAASPCASRSGGAEWQTARTTAVGRVVPTDLQAASEHWSQRIGMWSRYLEPSATYGLT